MLPSLPIEITQYIIQLSLPPRLLTIKHYRERYGTLLACSLVCVVWKEIAQKELIKHLLVGRYRTIELLSKEFTRRNAQDMRSIVVSLRFDGIGLGDLGCADDKDYKNLLSSCCGVKEIWIVKIFLSDVLDPALFNWRSFPQLESLHLIDMEDNIQDIDDIDFTSFVIPSLTHLTFYDVDGNCTPGLCSKILNSSIFPALVSLAIFIDISTYTSTFISESISTQLKKLILYNEDGAAEQAILPTLAEKMSSLEVLVLRDVLYLDFSLRIPPKLVTLRLHEISDGFLKDVEVLRDWITKMDPQRQLKNIIFSPPCKDDKEAVQAKNEVVKVELHNFLLDRGIELEYSDSWDDYEGYKLLEMF